MIVKNLQSRRTNCELIRRKLKEVQKALKKYLSNPTQYEEKIEKSRKWFSFFLTIITRIEINCYNLLLSDPSFYIKHDIDEILWKERFYKPIEVERSKMKEVPASQTVINNTKDLIIRILKHVL